MDRKNIELSKKYLELMEERIKKATERDIIIHGKMIYKCDHCGAYYIMNLEKGLEDPTDDAKTGKHKPVPYVFECLCCEGLAEHILWGTTADSLGKNYRNYKQYVNGAGIIFQNFFWNDPESDCGVPVLFEPDLFGEERLFAFVSAFCIPDDYLTLDFPENKEPMLDFVNREQRRHPKGNDRYKRSRSNKKLYEY